MFGTMLPTIYLIKMAHRVKCKECNSCMSALWVNYNRYYYCSFCRLWYGGREIHVVENPNQDKIDAASNKIEDPILEEENEGK
jgi:hypothetical protein